ncbi:MAG: outer membrane lipoprotein-sorting protein [Acidobacteriaceae bacterium]|nr:outer membrane lipoprotein-sorting protein [Acidobacteriaceae bacterium]
MKLIATIVLSATTLTAGAQSPQLQTVLSSLDKAALSFKSVQADVVYDNYVKVVHDHSKQTGKIVIERRGKNVTMGAVFFDPGNTQPAKIINYDGSLLHVFTPGINQDDQFKAGDNQAKYQSFLTLGFGGSGKELSEAWTITDLGQETVNGRHTEKLDLVSKDPSVRNMFTHVTIWIDPSDGLSARQVFFQPNGDSRTADYNNLLRNSSIKDRFSIPRSPKPQVVSH